MSNNRIWSGLASAVLAAALSGCKTSPQAAEAKYLARGKELIAQKDYSRALLEFRNAANAIPKDAEPYYQSGLAYLGTGNLLEAARFFRKAIDLNPNHTGAQLKLAEMMVNTRNAGMLEDAAKRLETILANAPDNTEASGTLAIAEWKLGQTEDAAKRLEDTLQRFPKSLQNSVTLAKMKLNQHDLSGAEQVLQKAVTSSPQSPEAALALGQFYWIAKQLDRAEVEMKRALQLDAKHAPALVSLAAMQVSLHRMEEAEQTYQRLSALPDPQYKHLHAIFLFQNGKQDAAVAELAKLSKENSDNREVRSLLLSAYVGTGKIQEAQRLLAGALKSNPKDTDALFQRAELYLRSGNAAGAKEDLNQVLHFKPDSAQAHYALAEVYQAEGLSQAKEEFTQALKLNPSMLPARLALARSIVAANAASAAVDLLDATPPLQKSMLGVTTQYNWALFALGNLKQMRTQLDDALKAGRFRELLVQDAVLKMREHDYVGARVTADELLRHNPEEVRAVRVIVDSYLAQNEPAKALGRLKELTDGHPKSAPLHDLLGRFQASRGKLPEARQAFEAAKAADPGFLPADLGLADLDRTEGHMDSARQRLTALLAAEPKNARAILMMADIESNTGDRASAIVRYKAAAEIEPNNVVVLNNLAYVLALDNPDEALKYAERAGVISPNSANVQDTLGWIYYRKGVYSTAAAYLKRAVDTEPTPRRQFHLGMAYLKTGDRDLGQKAILAALAKNPNLPQTEQGW
jgi:Tfp pilus assembly protein PilF